MSEQYKPLRIITTNNERVEFDHERAYLYTYAGENACYNHVFLVFPETDRDNEHAVYVWQDDPLYKDASEHLLENGFQVALNLIRVSEQDRQFFDWHFGLEEFEKTDTYPEAWNEHL